MGSVVEFGLDPSGSYPVFAVSTLSPHTRDLKEDKRASLTVMAQGFESLSDARVTLQGHVRQVYLRSCINTCVLLLFQYFIHT